MKRKLEKINRCPLKSQQKVEVIREIPTTKMIHHLDFTDATKDLMGKFDRFFNKYVRRWPFRKTTS